MLTAMLGGLAPFQVDADGDGVIDSFWERFTDDRVRMVATLAAAIIIGIPLFRKVKQWWQYPLAALVTFLFAWFVWGVVNAVWSPNDQPLVMFPVCLDFKSLFSWPLGLWWLLALAVFVAVMSSTRNRGLGTLVKAVSAAAVSVLVVLIGQYFYREGKEKVEEQQQDAAITLDVGTR